MRSRLPPCQPVIVDIHAEEAAILAANRATATQAPHRRLDDLATVDGRLAAHLDGLAIAAAHGAAAAEAGWTAAQEPGEVFVLLHTHQQQAPESAVVAALVAACVDPTDGPARRDSLVVACAWSGIALPAWLAASLPPATTARLRLDITAERRQGDGVQAADLAVTQPPAILARAIQAVGELGRADFYTVCRPHLASDDIAVRFWTARTLALRTASSESRKTLQWFATAKSPFAAIAATLAARRLAPADAQAWIDQLATTHLRLSIQAAGAAGDPVRLPWLLERCADPSVARVAGEAISLITGVDLAYLDLDGDQPAGFTPPGPTDDPADPNIDTDPDEHLPWPDVARLSLWLAQQSFPVGVRHLCGKPIDAEWCTHVLRDGYQRQRLAAAHELAAIDPTAPLFNTAAPAWAQRKALG